MSKNSKICDIIALVSILFGIMLLACMAVRKGCVKMAVAKPINRRDLDRVGGYGYFNVPEGRVAAFDKAVAENIELQKNEKKRDFSQMQMSDELRMIFNLGKKR